jgi:signal peptidase II
MDRASARLLAYGIAAVVFALDRITKAVIKLYFSIWDTWTVIPGFFNIVHTENPGAAFSLFSDAHSGWRTFFLVTLSTAALVVITALIWRMHGFASENRYVRLGLALILGGALGNVYDRIVHGTVTDFLELYYRGFSWPAFNVADSAITIGVGLVMLEMLRNRHAPRTA